MALPSSGPISLNDVNVELNLAGTTSINMNQSSVRTLFAVPSGTITMANGYGKSNRVTVSVTLSANTSNYTVNTAKAAGYAAGTTDFTLNINSGVIVSSSSTGSYSMTVDTSWAAGDTVTIVNNGVILGRGGNGGSGAGQQYPGSGTTGGSGGSGAGPALLVQRATSINNVNRIAGGGGGGGGGGLGFIASPPCEGTQYAAGGGGGGGIGIGSGGGGGQGWYAGGGGSGSSGTLTSAGGGGGGEAGIGGAGGAGGTYGTSGSSGGYGGGAGGAAIVGNSNITWIATGTRNGSIS